MAWYDMTDKVKRIAEVESTTVDSLAKEFGLTGMDGQLWATNRRQEGEVVVRLNRLENDIKKIGIAKEVKASFHWVKDEEGWAVAGDFSGKKEGDTIIVMKRDGSKQVKLIERFSCIGNAYVN